MIDVGDLRFQPHHWVRIIITYAGDVVFFWCSALSGYSGWFQWPRMCEAMGR